jgi:LacI family transcriptional regulator, repressor for deo operon, udp, cdd, tsx, nupC, and nupG
MGITIRDVAEAAGVSTATVSRALRGLPHVDPQTRERVEQVAKELDYVVSPSASRLASGRTGTIAVIAPFIARWFFSTVLSGVESVLQASDIDLLVFEVGDPAANYRVPPEQRLRGRVDGLLVVALPSDESAVADLLSLGLPVSLIGSTAVGVPSVSIDDVAAGRIATQHLINIGHERIGIITGQPNPTGFTPAEHRRQGFRAALDEAGLVSGPELEGYGYFTVAGGEQAMTGLLALAKPPTAVFAASDEMAFGAIRALQRHGLRPGNDVAIIGVDGHDLSDLLDLSTVVQPVRDLGRMATEALLAQLRLPRAERGQVATATAVPTTLVVRGSTVPSKDVARARLVSR